MRPVSTAGSFRSRPLAAHRGRFADRYVPCLTCGHDLLDVDGTGRHPTPDCDPTPGLRWTLAQRTRWMTAACQPPAGGRHRALALPEEAPRG